MTPVEPRTGAVSERLPLGAHPKGDRSTRQRRPSHKVGRLSAPPSIPFRSRLDVVLTDDGTHRTILYEQREYS